MMRVNRLHDRPYAIDAIEIETGTETLHGWRSVPGVREDAERFERSVGGREGLGFAHRDAAAVPRNRIRRTSGIGSPPCATNASWNCLRLAPVFERYSSRSSWIMSFPSV